MKITTTLTLLILASALSLTGCSRSCEDIQEDIQEIMTDLMEQGQSGWDRAEELEALRQELEDNGCLGG